MSKPTWGGHKIKNVSHKTKGNTQEWTRYSTNVHIRPYFFSNFYFIRHYVRHFKSIGN